MVFVARNITIYILGPIMYSDDIATYMTLIKASLVASHWFVWAPTTACLL